MRFREIHLELEPSCDLFGRVIGRVSGRAGRGNVREESDVGRASGIVMRRVQCCAQIMQTPGVHKLNQI